MIEKYYNGVIEQVAGGIGNVEHNSILVRYSNDFSIWDLESVNHYKDQTDIFFTCHEFSYNKIAEAYEPYLGLIRQMFHKYCSGTLEEFMEECDVYKLQRPVFESYFEKGFCERTEQILIDEVEYEQERMRNSIVTMLQKLSEIRPVVIVLNRFQLASKSTMQLSNSLLQVKNKNIGIVLGVNDVQSIPEFAHEEWDAICESMDDRNMVYHIGNAGRNMEPDVMDYYSDYESDDGYRKLNNLVYFLDFDQADHHLSKIERRIKFDNFTISEKKHYQLLLLQIMVSVLQRDIAKALESCEDLEKLQDQEKEGAFYYNFWMATSYMYLGKLEEAMIYVQKAKECGEALGDDFLVFRAELLKAQNQMSGWCNIFFCAQDIEISDKLIEKLNAYHYKNHLAHIYIYAYDNKPEIAAKAYRSEAFLIYFSKGVALAKEIGNEQLISIAYRKNIMIASTNGEYEVSLLYSIRTYEAMKDVDSVEGGRIYSGIAYNLCAMGENERAQSYYNKAIKILCKLRKPEDIAEVHYNMSLNCVMLGQYDKAQEYLTQCMKAIEKLHLNSLRVCNLSKLYGLFALVSILQGNRFNCERYLYSCRQFLNYIFEKEKTENNLATVHDYAKADDDMFLYTFSKALLAQHDGDNEEALKLYEQADIYLKRAEGNQFFCYVLFRRNRMECFRNAGKEILYEQEEFILKQYEETHRIMFHEYAEDMKDLLPPVDDDCEELSTREIEDLLKQESVERAYKSKKEQLDFISIWQKLINVNGITAKEMLNMVMKTFLNHFDVDRAVYIRYSERVPQVLYNDTEKEMTPEIMKIMEKSMRKNAGGFVISKISSNYSEHQDITSIFGDEDVCSMVAIPFFNNAKIENIVITYVLMKDNWHSSVNRYMLDEDDLNFYQLLFREVRYALNRLDAYDKIYEMNTKLYMSAVTDQLTGCYNREGFYRKLDALLKEIAGEKRKPKLGVMFIDLDNFKHYNDTYGHDVGDFVLIKMADIFTEVCGKDGFVCRYGGDEFLIFLYTDDRDIFKEKAERIYQIIDEADGFSAEISEKLGQSFSIDKQHQISCSIGIAAGDHICTENDMTEMIKRADDLLYSIKTTTKGTYRI